MASPIKRRTAVSVIAVTAATPLLGRAAQRATDSNATDNAVSFPPKLPGGKATVTEAGAEFLKPLVALRDGVTIAKSPPTIDFAYFPGQTYVGNPWSNWGDSTARRGKYYTAIGDHLAPAGNAFIYEYDAAGKSFRRLLDLNRLLNLPAGHYCPAKIHTRVDL